MTPILTLSEQQVVVMTTCGATSNDKGDIRMTLGFQCRVIGSDNGLSLGRRQAIIWTNAGGTHCGNVRYDEHRAVSTVFIVKYVTTVSQTVWGTEVTIYELNGIEGT